MLTLASIICCFTRNRYLNTNGRVIHLDRKYNHTHRHIIIIIFVQNVWYSSCIGDSQTEEYRIKYLLSGCERFPKKKKEKKPPPKKQLLFWMTKFISTRQSSATSQSPLSDLQCWIPVQHTKRGEGTLPSSVLFLPYSKTNKKKTLTFVILFVCCIAVHILSWDEIFLFCLFAYVIIKNNAEFISESLFGWTLILNSALCRIFSSKHNYSP